MTKTETTNTKSSNLPRRRCWLEEGRRLPPNIINLKRIPDVNQSDPNKAAVQAVHFHPGTDPDKPLILTAGLDKSLRFFSSKSRKVGKDSRNPLYV